MRAWWLAFLLALADSCLSAAGIALALLNGNPLPYVWELMPGAVVGVSFSLVGGLVASRRPRNAVGWVFLAIGLSQGFGVFAYEVAAAAYGETRAAWAQPLAPSMSVLGQLAWAPGISLMFSYALLLFPNGRLPSPRWRPVAWLGALPLAGFAIGLLGAWPHGGEAFFNDPSAVDIGRLTELAVGSLFSLMMVCGLLSVASLVFRFRGSVGAERKQLAWIMYGGALAIATISLDATVVPLGDALLAVVAAPAIPVAAGIAIMRYRLFEIDRLINGTLVYGLLTAVLAGIYLLGAVGLQAAFRALVGHESQLALVVSTLAVAALFAPLRTHLQGLIDRAFYRSRYDATQALAAFSQAARLDVEVEPLVRDLLVTIEGSLKPVHLSLWLREEPR